MNPDSGARDNFWELGVSPQLTTLLQRQGIEKPTAIQKQTIPEILSGKDVAAVGPPGSGKTLSYAVPIIDQLHIMKGKALILVPTTILAGQVRQIVQDLTKKTKIRSLAITSDFDVIPQTKALTELDPRILVGTTGRVLHLMKEKILSVDQLRILVLDEVDRLFDGGFKDDIDQITKRIPKERQTVMASATMSDGIRALARDVLKPDATYVELAPSGTIPSNVQQRLHFVESFDDKYALLLQLVARDPAKTIIVFCNTQNRTEEIARILRYANHKANALHKNVIDKDLVVKRLLDGSLRIVVATEIAARGLHIEHVESVINFDLPHDPADYVHRACRAGHGGGRGLAVTIATGKEIEQLQAIEGITGEEIRRVSPPYFQHQRQLLDRIAVK